MEELLFKNRMEWRDWLSENHNTCDGVWLIYFKKHTKKASVGYNDAVEEALCFGWIDSIVKTIDNEQYKQKYTPRRKNSIWSKLNKSRVEKMIQQGQMTEHGLLKIEEAKKNGQWDKAYGSREKPKIPKEFLDALEKDKTAYANFMNFANSHQTTYLYWYLSAKRPETKAKRLSQIVEFARKNEKPGMM
ncbi:MAG: YdeI/OmpD-associated family protein [Bacteroidales bacterium]|nr:YdeI/OmpD-associated family protein [Bacteroidales bacterium]